MSTNKSIAKSATLISLATLCSRILGFIRDIVIARLFGVYLYAQAFVIAFKIPNLFRDLLGEGATNAALVPVFSEYKLKHSKEEFWELANVVLNLLLVILASIVIMGVVLSPLIVRLIAPGFIADPDKLATTIRLNRIIFPYLILVCLAAYSMGILNSLQHFAVPAFAPCLLNVSIIVFAMLLGEGITGLASGVLVGGVLQLAVQIPLLYKKGFRLRLGRKWRHPAARQIGKLMLPRMFSSCIYQLNNFVDSIFGSLSSIVGEGGVAALYFSYRMILFPLGIFSTALSQAILPTFSRQALEDNYDNLKNTLSFGLRTTFLVMLPASVGLMILARPIIATLFSGGKFDAYSIDLTANTLFFYALGLVFYGTSRILQSCFFSLKDTVTPAKIAFLSLGANIILNSLLIYPLKLGGLALATSLSGLNACLFLFFILRKRLAPFPFKAIAFSFIRILLASLAMGLVCFVLMRKNIFIGEGRLAGILNLGFTILSATLSYLVFCVIFGVGEIKELWQWIVGQKKN